MAKDKEFKNLIKQYGEGVIQNASYILEETKQIVSVSPVIDIGLHGGIEEGTWTMLSGAPKCGKTTTALQIAKNGQDLGKRTFYLNVEGRFKKKNLGGIEGLNPDNVEVISSNQESILSAEDFLNIATYIIKTYPGCILIVDSVSQLCSAKELTEDITGQTRSLGPKIMSSFCKHMGGVVPIQNTIIIMINHLITNTSGYGPKYMEDGGRKSQYQVDNKLRQKLVSKWENAEKKQIGQIVTWDVVEASLGAPGATVESCIRYGMGLDERLELINLGIELAIIEQAKAWFQLPYSETKINGKPNVYKYFQDNPKDLKKLQQEIKGML